MEATSSMLNGTQTVLPGASQNSPDMVAPFLGDSAAPAFVCISSALRRLLLQAEITAPRLQIATLEGEAGTGKHLFAQGLHRQAHSVAALPFRRRDARVWLANEADTAILNGTLYLDRVDLLATDGQGLLLNLIKSLNWAGNAAGHGAGHGEAAGAARFVLLASVQTSLRQLASQGQFLPDLAFRLTAVRFAMPPLREHREDIAPITQALVDRICRRYQQPTAVLSPGSLPRLLQHSWPGNVRELASVLESAILNSTTGVLRPTDLHLDPAPQSLREPPAGAEEGCVAGSTGDDLTLEFMIRRHIHTVLDLNRGNKLRAARQLGISRSTLYRLIAGEPPLAS